MQDYTQPDAELAEILAGKQRRREELIFAVNRAFPGELQGPAERLREVMRKRPGAKNRQRLPRRKFLNE
jgi:hypothetical protein